MRGIELLANIYGMLCADTMNVDTTYIYKCLPILVLTIDIRLVKKS